MAEPAPAPTDRRVLRGQRNRDAVVQAFLDMVTEGDLAPTAQRLAERAGVSLRSVFHHFEDMESLYASAADLHVGRYASLLVPVDRGGSLDRRIAGVVDQRVSVLDAVLPVYRASALIAHRSPTVAARLERADELMRRQLAEVFAPELGPDPGWRLDALDALASTDGWVRLRVRQGLSSEAAAEVLRSTMSALLA